MSLQDFMVFLENHQLWAYLILFLGAYFETLIGFSFFIYGEIFFWGGSILAGFGILNIWYVIIVLFVGGFVGDTSSYYLGKKYGHEIFKKMSKIVFFKKFVNEKNLKKGKKFFDKYGAKSVFWGRLMGPVSWVAPFLAGVHHVKYREFLKYDFWGVVIGIGQFVVIGYFFGNQYQKIIESWVRIFWFIVVMMIVYFLWKKFFIEKKT